MLRTIGLIIFTASALAANADTLRGTATLERQVTLPDGLVLEATVSDVSRADAPSVLLADTTFRTSAQPSYDFTISYDPAMLQPRATYALRVTLSLDGRLVATTDTHYPVLRDGMAEDAVVMVVLRTID
jgi:putative lipoprotein